MIIHLCCLWQVTPRQSWDARGLEREGSGGVGRQSPFRGTSSMTRGFSPRPHFLKGLLLQQHHRLKPSWQYVGNIPPPNSHVKGISPSTWQFKTDNTSTWTFSWKLLRFPQERSWVSLVSLSYTLWSNPHIPAASHPGGPSFCEHFICLIFKSYLINLVSVHGGGGGWGSTCASWREGSILVQQVLLPAKLSPRPQKVVSLLPISFWTQTVERMPPSCH